MRWNDPPDGEFLEVLTELFLTTRAFDRAGQPKALAC